LSLFITEYSRYQQVFKSEGIQAFKCITLIVHGDSITFSARAMHCEHCAKRCGQQCRREGCSQHCVRERCSPMYEGGVQPALCEGGVQPAMCEASNVLGQQYERAPAV
jgi:hypothetical protein